MKTYLLFPVCEGRIRLQRNERKHARDVPGTIVEGGGETRLAGQPGVVAGRGQRRTSGICSGQLP